MPRLLEKLEQTSSSSPFSSFATSTMETQNSTITSLVKNQADLALSSSQETKLMDSCNHQNENLISMTSSNVCFTDSMKISILPEISEHPTSPGPAISSTAYNNSFLNDCYYVDNSTYDMEGFNLAPMSAVGTHNNSLSDCQMAENNWFNDDESSTLWEMDELWQFRKPEEEDQSLVEQLAHDLVQPLLRILRSYTHKIWSASASLCCDFQLVNCLLMFDCGSHGLIQRLSGERTVADDEKPTKKKKEKPVKVGVNTTTCLLLFKLLPKPFEEELNPFSIFPSPEENFKVHTEIFFSDRPVLRACNSREILENI
ncbi:hypothetical protein F0562_034059 [Nyssa sinensis]|uniref:Uncharacterized protein n=1 Tax=Nyssa sinensis TaxID=561372 RepID=A0A5J5AH14_9ASTE|nr:hypothetical protein F0562_034059 [Nyssa sinensis]